MHLVLNVNVPGFELEKYDKRREIEGEMNERKYREKTSGNKKKTTRISSVGLIIVGWKERRNSAFLSCLAFCPGILLENLSSWNDPFLFDSLSLFSLLLLVLVHSIRALFVDQHRQ